MLKEVIRKFKVWVLVSPLISASFIIPACSSESESAKSARLLYERAESLNQAGNPQEAIQLLDSLRKTYPSETKWQRAAMKLRPDLILNDSELAISNINDSIAILESVYNELLPRMKKVSDARLVEPYYTAASIYNPNFMETTGIQPRVSDIGQFYFVSSVNGLGLKHTGFSMSGAGETASAGPVPFDGEMNYRINGGEVITYSPEQSDAIGELAARNPGEAMTVTLTGSKNKTLKLSAKEVKAIADCYNFSRSIIEARQLAFERERLNRQIEIARSQNERLNSQEQ